MRNLGINFVNGLPDKIINIMMFHYIFTVIIVTWLRNSKFIMDCLNMKKTWTFKTLNNCILNTRDVAT